MQRVTAATSRLATMVSGTARRVNSDAGERGAIAVVIGALLLALIGIAAFVIDVGAVFEERRDLQNGADAAALAIAQECAVVLGCAASDEQSFEAMAGEIAGLNTNDGSTSIVDIDLGTSGEVVVRVGTLDASDGDDEIDFTLAPAIGDDGQHVQAVGSAQWGPPGAALAIPIIISSCEWFNATGDGETYDVPTIISLHDSGPDNGLCSFGPGMDVDEDDDRNEGGFGYLDSDDCESYINLDDGYVVGQTGAANPGSLGCQVSDVLNQTLLIPIFDDIPDDGNPCSAPPGQPCYHLYGFGAFHVTDVDLAGGQWKNNGNICPSSDHCLGGYFTEYVSLDDVEGWDSGGPELGVDVVALTWTSD